MYNFLFWPRRDVQPQTLNIVLNYPGVSDVSIVFLNCPTVSMTSLHRKGCEWLPVASLFRSKWWSGLEWSWEVADSAHAYRGMRRPSREVFVIILLWWTSLASGNSSFLCGFQIWSTEQWFPATIGLAVSNSITVLFSHIHACMRTCTVFVATDFPMRRMVSWYSRNNWRILHWLGNWNSYKFKGTIICSMNIYLLALSFMGRGLIDAPMDEVSAFVKKVENNLTWDKFLIVSSARDLEYAGRTNTQKFRKIKGPYTSTSKCHSLSMHTLESRRPNNNYLWVNS